MVLKIKRDEEGRVKKFKSRVVAGGNRQVFNRDYNNVYAPVINFIIWLLTMLIAFNQNWSVMHVDVKAAFLNGEIDRDIYVYFPYNVPNDHLRRKVYKLVKSLYGLKQAPLLWFKKLREVLINVLGYTQLQTDCTVFMCRSGKLVIMLVFVDDITFTSDCSHFLESEISSFLTHFDGTREKLSWYLGIRVQVSNNRISFSQSTYIDQILKTFSLEDCNTYATPITENFYELNEHRNDEIIDSDDYRNMIGCLQFLAHRTRPDISLAVGILSQYCHKQTNFLKRSVHRVFGYLKSTRTFGLVFTRSETRSSILQFYSDSDYAGDKQNRKSRTGTLGLIFGNLFLWRNKKQNCVALSTPEAEYFALCDAACDNHWIRSYLAEIGIDTSSATPIFCDNTTSTS